jgi:hypothetical protein
MQQQEEAHVLQHQKQKEQVRVRAGVYVHL